MMSENYVNRLLSVYVGKYDEKEKELYVELVKFASAKGEDTIDLLFHLLEIDLIVNLEEADQGFFDSYVRDLMYKLKQMFKTLGDLI